MPIFEYQCKACGRRFDVLHKIAAPPPSRCPDCGATELEKCLSAPGFQLRGEGWRRGTARPPQTTPKRRRIGHTLDGNAPHSHEEPASRGRLSGPAPGPPSGPGHAHSHTHGHGHDHDH